MFVADFQARGELKAVKEATKRRIQQDFIDQLSLRVDFPIVGTGNTLTGPVARRLFQNETV